MNIPGLWGCFGMNRGQVYEKCPPSPRRVGKGWEKITPEHACVAKIRAGATRPIAEPSIVVVAKAVIPKVAMARAMAKE